MSNVYNLEPPTQGKVVLRTTLGDIDVELWPKEAPKAVRNFVQLCLEGYYDGTVFHRVIKDFLAQGGDPSGTGEGGESVYGRPFRDEFHPRLRFAHRGLLACANRNAPDTNGSQFFISLDRADALDRKYTIFGKVTGDTIYNVIRFNELEVDEGTDRPAHPPVLTRADVLWNPFEDVVPRVDRDAKEVAAREAAAAAEAAARDARKAAAKKNFSLISFGDEAEEEEADAEKAAGALRIRSAHDALEDERLSRQAAVEVDLGKVREAMRAARAPAAAPGDAGGDKAGGGGGMEERLRQKVLAGKRKAGDDGEPPARRPFAQPGAAYAGGEGEQEEPAAAAEVEEGEEEEESEEEAEEKASALAALGRGSKSAAAAVAPSRQVKVADGELLTNWERKRKEYQERRRLGGHRERETLAKLDRFKQGLRGSAAAKETTAAAAAAAPAPADAAAAAPGGSAEGPPQQQQQEKEAEGGVGEGGYAGQVRGDVDHRLDMPAAWRVDDYLAGASDSDDDLASLRAHTLAFAKGAKDAMARSDDVDDYIVHDPLLEAGKAKFSKKAAAAKKANTEWGGGGGGGRGGGDRGGGGGGGGGSRGWDRDRERGGGGDRGRDQDRGGRDRDRDRGGQQGRDRGWERDRGDRDRRR